MYKDPLVNGIRRCQDIYLSSRFSLFKFLRATSVLLFIPFAFALGQWQPINTSKSDNANTRHSTPNIEFGTVTLTRQVHYHQHQTTELRSANLTKHTVSNSMEI
jgi:hypothetical protein